MKRREASVEGQERSQERVGLFLVFNIPIPDPLP